MVTLFGGIRLDDDIADFTGQGYADFSAQTIGESVTFNLTECRAGPHTLAWRYALSGSLWYDEDDKQMALIINGAQLSPLLNFRPTQPWETWTVLASEVNLTGGLNRVTLASAG